MKKHHMKEMGLFHTPSSVREIVTFIDSLPIDQRPAAWTVYGLLNNLIVDRVRESIRGEATLAVEGAVEKASR